MPKMSFQTGGKFNRQFEFTVIFIERLIVQMIGCENFELAMWSFCLIINR